MTDFTGTKCIPGQPSGLQIFGVLVVLAAFDIGFYVLWWDKTHLMAECGQFASPMVRASAELPWRLPVGRSFLKNANS